MDFPLSAVALPTAWLAEDTRAHIIAAVPGVPEPANDNGEPVQPVRLRRGRYQKRVAVVSFVARFKQRHGRAPSLPEMAAAFPTVSKSAAQRYRVAA